MNTNIVLFLKPHLNIDFEVLIKKLEKTYKDLGSGFLLSKNKLNPNQPNFIFNQNKELIIDGNHHHITLSVLNEYNKIKNDIIDILWDVFDYTSLEFQRVGYITEIPYKIENTIEIKKKLLNKDLINDVDEFQVSYHNTIKFQRKNINCWRRFIKLIKTPLIITYDFNTKENSFTEINYKTLKEFIKFSELFIENDIKNYIKGEMV